MAMIKCPECGKEISDRAEVCPGCGYPVKDYLQETKDKEQREIPEKKWNESEKKVSMLIKNRKFQISAIVLAILVLAIVMVDKWIHVEVIHDVTWGMSVSQVKQREDKYDGNSGYYDEENGYYAVSDVDYLGESVTLMYIFEDGKLASFCIRPTYGSYENVYKMALEMCRTNNLPVSFEDNADDEYIPRSVLQWNVRGTTIELIGNYENKYAPEYYFSLKPYKGKEFGEKYENRGTCYVGNKTLLPCRNEITPWCEINDEGNGYCYEHGCYVIGCPKGFANVYDRESLCLEHHFLCE